MFAYIRYLILTIFFVILTQTASAASENQETEAETIEEAYSPLASLTNGTKNRTIHVAGDSRQNSKCVERGRRCNETCDCCQHGIDSYDCVMNKNDRRKYCTTTQPPPFRCPINPHRPCRPVDGACKRDCDCCQRDEQKKQHRVNCYIEQNERVGKCYPQPYLIIDCFPPPPPSQIPIPPPPKA